MNGSTEKPGFPPPCARSRGSWRPFLIAGLLGLSASLVEAATRQPFLEQHCYDCHDAETKEGGLDLATLQTDFANPKVFAAWVRVHDRVAAGEMPPPEQQQRPDAQAVKAFTEGLEGRLHDFVAARQSATGRVVARRLTREEYERTLHELLGVRIPLADLLPEDVKTGGFTRIADGQPLSPVLLERYLEAADAALETAFDLALQPREPASRSFGVDALVQPSPWFYGGPPDAREGYAAIWNYFVADDGGGKFYGRLPATTARETGWHRITLRASALHPREGHVWAALHGGGCDTATPQLHWIGWLDATPEPRQFVFEALMNRGDMLRLRPVDDTSAWKGRVREGDRLVLPGGRTPEDANIPGVAVEWLHVERLADGLPAEEVRRRLFGASGVAPDDEASLEARVHDFAERAFRRPVVVADLAPQFALAHEALRSGESGTTALRTAYLGILTSPRFIFLQEHIDSLDDHALAARLSYFLWSLPPDAELRRLADAGRLREPEVLRGQTDRLLDDPRSQNFIDTFTAQWLDLDNIDFTSPDAVLYPEFDEILKHSMLGETRGFFRELLVHDLSTAHLVRSDFTMLNGRLARHYGLPGPGGLAFERVALPAASMRGGLVTHGSVLKVTANGTTTSPVLRGVWLLERILGQHVPPPPANVPAVEPDIRGAKTIREQLSAHSHMESCAACHRHIDPPGFALESFDPIGGWRAHYRTVTGEGRKTQWADGLPVDPSGTTADGAAFRDIREFRAALLEKPEQITRSLAEQLIAYATGAGISFADRREVARITAHVCGQSHGVRSLIHAVVQSPLFQNK